jgi:hypothetical protein
VPDWAACRVADYVADFCGRLPVRDAGPLIWSLIGKPFDKPNGPKGGLEGNKPGLSGIAACPRLANAPWLA